MRRTFLAKYRSAQRARVERIDASAKALLAKKAEARARLKAARRPFATRYSPPIPDLPGLAHRRRSSLLRSLAIEPSDRAYGSLWGANPIVSNYGSVGFGRVCTPESWLSNWSALSSNASIEACAPAITQPTLMIEYTGDNSVFPKDADPHFFRYRQQRARSAIASMAIITAGQSTEAAPNGTN